MPDWQKTVKSSKVGASSNLTVRRLPARIMINISGPGIEKPLVQIWNTHTGETPPSSFEFVVPRGSKRLVQVFAITRDFYYRPTGEFVTEGLESFFYGDTTKDLANPTEDIEIAVNEMSLGSQGLGEGVISGRYLDQDGTGPTGKVHMFFKPPNAPPMIVAEDEIHGGWFEFFRMDGVNFFYVLEDGRRLFEDFTIENPGFIWNSARALIQYPSGWRNINSNPDNGRKPVPQKHLIAGFFGPGSQSGNKRICIPGEEVEANLHLYTDETSDTRVVWVGKTQTLSPEQAGVILGGETPDQCEEGSWLEDWLHPDINELGNTHEAMGFLGAFQLLTDNIREGSEGRRSFLNVTYSDPQSQKVELKWRYLPGVTGSGRIAGVEVFSRILPDGTSSGDRRDYENGDGILCGELTNKNRFSIPFTFRKAVRYSPDSLDQSTEITGIEYSDWQAGRVQFVLCPYNDKKEYYSSGVVYDSYWYSGGGGGQTISAASLTIEGAPQLLNGLCHPITVKLYDNDENVIQLPSGPGVQVNVFVPSGLSDVALYDGSDIECTGSSSTSKTVHMSGGGQAIGQLRVKASASISSVDLAAEILTSGVQVGDIFGYSAPISRLHVTAKTNNGNSITSGGCYPVQFIIGQPLPVSADLILTGVSGSALFYQNIFPDYNSCDAGVSPLTLAAMLPIPASTQQTGIYYVKLSDPVEDGTYFKFEFDSVVPASGGGPIQLESTSLNISCSFGECLSPNL